MAVIGLIGPHAVGKTTALRRWRDRYGDRIAVTSFDAERKAYPGNPEKQSHIARCRADGRVWVMESARGFSGWVTAFLPSEPVIVLTCPEPAGRAWMVERRKGRPMSDYWTQKRLDYECNGHLLNYVRKLPPAQVRHFVIEDRERDWPAVDEYFGFLFRRAYNGLRSARVEQCQT